MGLLLTQVQKEPLAPLIFVLEVDNLTKLKENLGKTLGSPNAIKYKCLPNLQIRLQPSTTAIQTYRTIIVTLDKKKRKFHTFQIKQESAFGVVMHMVTTPEDINDLGQKEFLTRNAFNIKSAFTKSPTRLFYADLEPEYNNKSNYTIIHTIISIKPPRKTTHIQIPYKCQQYDHTKTYCKHYVLYFECGKNHRTPECRIDSTSLFHLSIVRKHTLPTLNF